LKANQEVIVYKSEGVSHKAKISKIYRTVGVSRIDVEEGRCGDVVIVAGIPDIFVGDTIGQE
jgi:GTP-binding protein